MSRTRPGSGSEYCKPERPRLLRQELGAARKEAEENPRRVPRPVESAPQPKGQTQPHEQRSSIGEAQVSSVAAETATAGSAPLADSNTPELLAMEGEERNFMLGLAGAVGKSPRRLKRFVNTHRLLKASLDGLQRETLSCKEGARVNTAPPWHFWPW